MMHDAYFVGLRGAGMLAAAGVLLCAAACGDDGKEGNSAGATDTESTDSGSGTASGTSSTTASGTDSASGTSMASDSNSGTTTGMSSGTGSSSATGGSTGGTTGGATCPGTQVGCVVDFAGAFMQTGASDGTGTAARFDFISGITSVGGFVYVTDNHAVRRIDVATAEVTTWAGGLATTGYVDGIGTGARFDGPVGIATDGTTIWVAEQGNALIRAIAIASADVTTLAGSQGNLGSADGMGAAATIDAVRDLDFDGTYLWFIQANGVLRRIDPTDGAVITVAGSAGQAGYVDGVGAAARFDAPRFVEAVGAGLLYVSDTENHRPRYVVVNGGAGTVTSPYGGGAGYMDGNGTAARFNRQRGLAWDEANSLAVADSDNYVIREIDLGTDEVITIAGTAGNVAHAEGLGAAAAFDKPLDMHHDAGTGDLFISEGAVLRRMYR